MRADVTTSSGSLGGIPVVNVEVAGAVAELSLAALDRLRATVAELG